MSDHSTAIVSFTRDLRVHDNPAPERACRLARRVVLLFVVHEGLGFATANRRRVLHESPADPRQSLRDVGGDLLVRHGDPVTELMRLAEQVHAGTIVLARDVSRYARRRADRIRAATVQQRIRVEFVDAVTVVPPAASTPGCVSSQPRGFLHNRVRLVVASFLTKQLGLHWGVGARHFFDQLVDGGQGGGHR
ncbi:deoxyribodipyrimidine photo-lyase [Actinocatenispora sera]|uniref:deoxyribodipyrimidine photo-lyase n=1 Tax=Actinocatenispora sera TaxID=390989 RepID=UPI0033D6600B